MKPVNLRDVEGNLAPGVGGDWGIWDCCVLALDLTSAIKMGAERARRYRLVSQFIGRQI